MEKMCVFADSLTHLCWAPGLTFQSTLYPHVFTKVLEPTQSSNQA